MRCKANLIDSSAWLINFVLEQKTMQFTLIITMIIVMMMMTILLLLLLLLIIIIINTLTGIENQMRMILAVANVI